MDGLSIAASIAGLVQIGAKIIDFISTAGEASTTARNVLAEAKALQAIFHQLQEFILTFEDGSSDRKSMTSVNQLVATLTGCVCTFTDLVKVLENLNANWDAGSALSLWRRTKWACKDRDLTRILSDLQNHKSSLNILLTIINWSVRPSFQKSPN
jgi:hypothetical protein